MNKNWKDFYRLLNQFPLPFSPIIIDYFPTENFENIFEHRFRHTWVELESNHFDETKINLDIPTPNEKWSFSNLFSFITILMIEGSFAWFFIEQNYQHYSIFKTAMLLLIMAKMLAGFFCVVFFTAVFDVFMWLLKDGYRVIVSIEGISAKMIQIEYDYI